MLHLHITMGSEKKEPAPDLLDAVVKALPAVAALFGPMTDWLGSAKKPCAKCGEEHDAPMRAPEEAAFLPSYPLTVIARAAKRAGFNDKDVNDLLAFLDKPETE